MKKKYIPTRNAATRDFFELLKILVLVERYYTGV